VDDAGGGGRWCLRLLRNVYADPGLPVDHRLYARAATLLMPEDCVLGGRSAAGWFGAPFAGPADHVLVLVPQKSAWRGPTGVQVHRTNLTGGDVVEVDDGIRLTAAARTAWDVAALETVPTAVGFLDGMVRAGCLDLEAFRRSHDRARGRWRVGQVGKVLPLVDGRSESPPESWVPVACARAGLPAPTPQYVVLADGVFLGRVDLGWTDARVIVEYEGAHHFGGMQIARDDERCRRLLAAGWVVIRLSATDLRDMDAVVARIARALQDAMPS
jgi:hypothetical protein